MKYSSVLMLLSLSSLATASKFQKNCFKRIFLETSRLSNKLRISGDFNPSSTSFSATIIKRMCGMTQSVKVLTRDTGILDWLLTNRPSLMSDPVQLPNRVVIKF